MINEAFEKWAIDYGLDYESSFTRDDVEASWQAAKADSEQEIAELKNEVIEKCANVCDSWSLIGKSIAHEIRALKG